MEHETYMYINVHRLSNHEEKYVKHVHVHALTNKQTFFLEFYTILINGLVLLYLIQFTF